jgi:hypothetical protein
MQFYRSIMLSYNELTHYDADESSLIQTFSAYIAFMHHWLDRQIPTQER